jgi:hypothetical protein
MDILEVVVKVKWHDPNEGDVPSVSDIGCHFYCITKYNEHKILSWQGETHGINWYGDWGTNSNMSNEAIKCWTNLLPQT